MTGVGRNLLRPSAAIVLSMIIGLSGCHSYHIETTVENQTGTAIQLLEVDYPSASFGVDHLDAAAVFHYRFQVRGSGQLTLQYSDATGQQIRITGPTLAERQQGQLQIVLLPGGKTEFHPQLSAQP